MSNGITSEDLAVVPDPALHEVVVQEQRRLARGGRALERRPADADDRATTRERGQHLPQPFRAADGVELVAALREPRRRVEVVVGAEGDDEHVRLVDAAGRRHPPRLGVDRGDRLLEEADARLAEVVTQPDLVGVARPKSTSSFSVWTTPHARRSASRRRRRRTPREDGRELEAAEARAEDEGARHHRTTLSHRRTVIGSRS